MLAKTTLSVCVVRVIQMQVVDQPGTSKLSDKYLAGKAFHVLVLVASINGLWDHGESALDAQSRLETRVKGPLRDQVPSIVVTKIDELFRGEAADPTDPSS
jgi:hypothetical protein